MTKPSYSAFFIPTKNEAKALLKHFRVILKKTFETTHIYEGEFKNISEKALVVITGIGFLKAEKAARHVLNHYQICEVGVFGVCGGVEKELEPGDTVIAKETGFENEEDIFLKSDPGLIKKLENVFSKKSISFHSGKILTVKNIIKNPEDKKMYDSLAVEMEAYPILREAYDKKIPSIHVRWVLDTSRDEVPSQFVLDEKVKLVLKKMGEFFDFYFDENKKEK